MTTRASFATLSLVGGVALLMLALRPAPDERESSTAEQATSLVTRTAAPAAPTGPKPAKQQVELPKKVGMIRLIRAGRASVSEHDIEQYYAENRSLFGSRSRQAVTPDIREILAYGRAREILAADGVEAWREPEDVAR